ncbi:hypothetical protein SAMN04488574_11454 [Bacillus sp. 71mf]|nr:hypothetical protein SAMN04488574_11454 [Bacillus sp. 71mf]SFT18332.1 hypothetical protein SAMN04488145_11726 [Bacillus sp. 103mf]
MNLKLKRPLMLLIPLYIILVLFDYNNYNQFKWIENIIQSLFLVIFYEFFMWSFSTEKESNSKH